MAQCRDLENQHNEKLMELAILILEKVLKNELEEEISDDLRIVRSACVVLNCLKLATFSFSYFTKAAFTKRSDAMRYDAMSNDNIYRITSVRGVQIKR